MACDKHDTGTCCSKYCMQYEILKFLVIKCYLYLIDNKELIMLKLYIGSQCEAEGSVILETLALASLSN